MKRVGLLVVILSTALGLSVRVRAAVEYVLVSCTPEQCDYQVVTSVTLGGKPAVRLARAPLETVNPAALQRLDESKIETLPGLYRDPATQIVYRLGPDGSKQDVALPLKLTGAVAVSTGLAWQGAMIEYIPIGAKAKATVSVDRLAYLMVSTNAEQSVFQLLQRLIAPTETDPRRTPLIRGAAQFNAKSPTLQTWKASLINRIREQMQRIDAQSGDPSTLRDALREAVQLRAVYVQVGEDKANKELLDRVVAADELFSRRLAIADALRGAALWDDYLVKIRQLGLAKWSMPEAQARIREALAQSAQIHHERSLAFTTAQHFDRAFDEAQLAARNSCDTDVIAGFKTTRTRLVNRNVIPSAMEYTSADKELLDQIVRGLDQLDPNKEQVTLEEIRKGEAIDPNFLPLQWKKIEFLDKLGRYTEALAVLHRIERSVRLDIRERELGLGLDGRITNNLADAIQKSHEETRTAFDAGRYQDALAAAARGLKANPVHAELLYYSAMSAAFLRQTPVAVGFIRTYLADASMHATCAGASDPAKILDLSRSIGTPAAQQAPAAGMPNWISGMPYELLDAPYDPISLGFLQPITRISSEGDGVTTMFQRDDRSFLVNAIVTSKANLKAMAGSATATLFEAEPKYDRATLSMLEIGPKSASTAARPANRLTYLNSPTMDIGLVSRFTGRQVARGWAGNPFFLPFVWNGYYFFDFTYDALGRVANATPVSEEAGAIPDSFSEPLEFTWVGDTKLLQSVRGKRSGYLRELRYAKTGHLISEVITAPGGKGSVEYEYWSNSSRLSGAKYTDNFWDKRDRVIHFLWDSAKHP